MQQEKLIDLLTAAVNKAQSLIQERETDLSVSEKQELAKTLGIGAVKTSWNRSQGVKVDYVDPACLVYSYTEDPNFEDILANNCFNPKASTA